MNLPLNLTLTHVVTLYYPVLSEVSTLRTVRAHTVIESVTKFRVGLTLKKVSNLVDLKV